MEQHARHVLDLYTTAYPNAWVRHHLDSYNDFLSNRIPNFLKAMSPTAQLKNGNRTIKLYVGGKSADLIRYTPMLDDDGKPMLPNTARLKDLTYTVGLNVDIDVEYEINMSDGSSKTINRRILDVEVCKLPQPVLSQYCSLSAFPPGTLGSVHECQNEVGGYFIIDGAEKYLTSQESMASNVLYTKRMPDADIYYESMAEVRSGSEDGKYVPRPHKVYVCREVLETEGALAKTSDKERSDRSKGALAKTSEATEAERGNAVSGAERGSLGDRTESTSVNRKSLKAGMVAHVWGLSEPIPLCILFRALGVETDADIVEHILVGVSQAQRQSYAPRLVEMLLARNVGNLQIWTTPEAIAYIATRLRQQSRYAVLDMLENWFLPHCGHSLHAKAMFLGRMAKRALDVALGLESPSDRDNFKFKRMEVTGDLMFNLWLEQFPQIIEEFRRTVDTKLTYDTDVYKNERVANLLQPENMKYYFKGGLLDDKFIKSFKGQWQGKTGVAQELPRISYLGAMSAMRRSMLQIGDRLKVPEPRRLHGSSWGFMCPTDSPDGGDLGLKKHLALLTTTSTLTPSQDLWNAVAGVDGFKPIEALMPQDIRRSDLSVFLNGAWIGIHSDPLKLNAELKSQRSQGKIPRTVSLAWNIQRNEFSIYTDSGRWLRPLYRIKKSLLEENDILKLKSWSALEQYIDYVDAEESETLLISMKPAVKPYVRTLEDLQLSRSDQVLRFTHSEIHPSFVLSVSTGLIPYCQNNQSPRNMFSVAQARSAIGMYATNWRYRFDTASVVLYGAQKPIVQTQLQKYVGKGSMSSGVNSIVAVMSYTGYNQEDSILVNEGALRRQFFNTGYFKLFQYSEEALDELAQTKTIITNPLTGKYSSAVIRKDGYDYNHLDDDGIIKPNTLIKPGMVLIGCVAPTSDGGWADISVTTKKDSEGRVDSVYKFTKQSGLRSIKVRIHDYRVPTAADKFAVRSCAQKGTIGLIVPEADMPFTSTGLRPDIIMNPHAIPSRMTGAMTHEMIASKAAVLAGMTVDATAFVPRDDPLTAYGRILESHGYDKLGEEYLYNGMTGERMLCTIFMGSVYYSRLKHMVQDKINSRTTGPKKLLTHQPTGGRANDGGLRIGEMERDALLSHGISNFIQECMVAKADGYETIFNPDTGRIDVMLNEKQPAKVQIPYCMKLLIQEIESMGMDMKLVKG